MGVDDSGLEVLRKAAQEITPGDRSNYVLQLAILKAEGSVPVDDSGLEVLRKVAQEVTPGDKSNYVMQAKILSGMTVPVGRTAYVDLINGDDSAGQVGVIGAPFLTIAAAEAAITDAAEINQYVLMIGPGDHDVTGLVKKPDIKWQGQGAFLTRVQVTSGSLDLAHADYALAAHRTEFEGVRFNPCPIVCDLFTVGSTFRAQFQFKDCFFDSPSTFTGRSAEDSIFYFGGRIASTPNSWYSMSVYIFGMFNTGDGGDVYRIASANGNFAQAFIFASLFGAPFKVEGVDFVITGFVGCIVNELRVDGTAAVIYLEDSTTIAEPVFSGGATAAQFVYLSNSKRTGYTPAVSGDWSPVPTQVAEALDQLAAASFSDENARRYALLVGY
jgi:hypothetical protein